MTTRKALAVLPAVIVLAVFLACASQPPSTPGGDRSPATAAPHDAAPGPGTTPADAMPIGQETSPAAGWVIKVTGPATDVTAAVKKANQFNPPRTPGNVLVGVPVTLRNVTGKPASPNTDVKVGLLTPSGAILTPLLMVASYDTANLNVSLQPAGELTGTVLYEVPAADVSATVLLAEPRFTLDENDDQRFLAVR